MWAGFAAELKNYVAIHGDSESGCPVSQVLATAKQWMDPSTAEVAEGLRSQCRFPLPYSPSSVLWVLAGEDPDITVLHGTAKVPQADVPVLIEAITGDTPSGGRGANYRAEEVRVVASDQRFLKAVGLLHLHPTSIELRFLRRLACAGPDGLPHAQLFANDPMTAEKASRVRGKMLDIGAVGLIDVLNFADEREEDHATEGAVCTTHYYLKYYAPHGGVLTVGGLPTESGIWAIVHSLAVPILIRRNRRALRRGGSPADADQWILLSRLRLMVLQYLSFDASKLLRRRVVKRTLTNIILHAPNAEVRRGRGYSVSLKNASYEASLAAIDASTEVGDETDVSSDGADDEETTLERSEVQLLPSGARGAPPPPSFPVMRFHPHLPFLLQVAERVVVQEQVVAFPSVFPEPINEVERGLNSLRSTLGIICHRSHSAHSKKVQTCFLRPSRLKGSITAKAEGAEDETECGNQGESDVMRRIDALLESNGGVMRLSEVTKTHCRKTLAKYIAARKGSVSMGSFRPDAVSARVVANPRARLLPAAPPRARAAISVVLLNRSIDSLTPEERAALDNRRTSTAARKPQPKPQVKTRKSTKTVPPTPKGGDRKESRKRNRDRSSSDSDSSVPDDGARFDDEYWAIVNGYCKPPSLARFFRVHLSLFHIAYSCSAAVVTEAAGDGVTTSIGYAIPTEALYSQLSLATVAVFVGLPVDLRNLSDSEWLCPLAHLPPTLRTRLETQINGFSHVVRQRMLAVLERLADRHLISIESTGGDGKLITLWLRRSWVEKEAKMSVDFLRSSREPDEASDGSTSGAVVQNVLEYWHASLSSKKASPFPPNIPFSVREKIALSAIARIKPTLTVPQYRALALELRRPFAVIVTFFECWKGQVSLDLPQLSPIVKKPKRKDGDRRAKRRLTLPDNVLLLELFNAVKAHLEADSVHDAIVRIDRFLSECSIGSVRNRFHHNAFFKLVQCIRNALLAGQSAADALIALQRAHDEYFNHEAQPSTPSDALSLQQCLTAVSESESRERKRLAASATDPQTSLRDRMVQESIKAIVFSDSCCYSQAEAANLCTRFTDVERQRGRDVLVSKHILALRLQRGRKFRFSNLAIEHERQMDPSEYGWDLWSEAWGRAASLPDGPLQATSSSGSISALDDEGAAGFLLDAESEIGAALMRVLHDVTLGDAELRIGSIPLPATAEGMPHVDEEVGADEDPHGVRDAQRTRRPRVHVGEIPFGQLSLQKQRSGKPKMDRKRAREYVDCSPEDPLLAPLSFAASLLVDCEEAMDSSCTEVGRSGAQQQQQGDTRAAFSVADVLTAAVKLCDDTLRLHPDTPPLRSDVVRHVGKGLDADVYVIDAILLDLEAQGAVLSTPRSETDSERWLVTRAWAEKQRYLHPVFNGQAAQMDSTTAMGAMKKNMPLRSASLMYWQMLNYGRTMAGSLKRNGSLRNLPADVAVPSAQDECVTLISSTRHLNGTWHKAAQKLLLATVFDAVAGCPGITHDTLMKRLTCRGQGAYTSEMVDHAIRRLRFGGRIRASRMAMQPTAATTTAPELRLPGSVSYTIAAAALFPGVSPTPDVPLPSSSNASTAVANGGTTTTATTTTSNGTAALQK